MTMQESQVFISSSSFSSDVTITHRWTLLSSPLFRYNARTCTEFKHCLLLFTGQIITCNSDIFLYIVQDAALARKSTETELLLIRGREDIRRQVTGTVKDTAIYFVSICFFIHFYWVSRGQTVIHSIIPIPYIIINSKRRIMNLNSMVWPFCLHSHSTQASFSQHWV